MWQHYYYSHLWVLAERMFDVWGKHRYISLEMGKELKDENCKEGLGQTPQQCWSFAGTISTLILDSRQAFLHYCQDAHYFASSSGIWINPKLSLCFVLFTNFHLCFTLVQNKIQVWIIAFHAVHVMSHNEIND